MCISTKVSLSLKIGPQPLLATGSFGAGHGRLLSVWVDISHMRGAGRAARFLSLLAVIWQLSADLVISRTMMTNSDE